MVRVMTSSEIGGGTTSSEFIRGHVAHPPIYSPLGLSVIPAKCFGTGNYVFRYSIPG